MDMSIDLPNPAVRTISQRSIYKLQAESFSAVRLSSLQTGYQITVLIRLQSQGAYILFLHTEGHQNRTGRSEKNL